MPNGWHALSQQELAPMVDKDEWLCQRSRRCFTWSHCNCDSSDRVATLVLVQTEPRRLYESLLLYGEIVFLNVFALPGAFVITETHTRLRSCEWLGNVIQSIASLVVISRLAKMAVVRESRVAMILSAGFYMVARGTTHPAPLELQQHKGEELYGLLSSTLSSEHLLNSRKAMSVWSVL